MLWKMWHSTYQILLWSLFWHSKEKAILKWNWIHLIIWFESNFLSNYFDITPLCVLPMHIHTTIQISSLPDSRLGNRNKSIDKYALDVSIIIFRWISIHMNFPPWLVINELRFYFKENLFRVDMLKSQDINMNLCMHDWYTVYN